jgi:transcriptional regulator with XRE-family HTH domain
MELTAWMAEAGLTSGQLAEKLKVTENTVARWRGGWRRPRDADLVALREVSGGKVTANDFYMRPKRQARPSVVAASSVPA